MKVASTAWQDKIERAELLASQTIGAAEVLRFYARLLAFQGDVAHHLSAGKCEVGELVPFVPDLLALLSKSGTQQMKLFIERSARADWHEELQACWDARTTRLDSADDFVSTALLQPYAHELAARSEINLKTLQPRCPFCDRAPQLGVLRPEGDGGKRYLYCGLCGTEWEYRRVICPNCEQTDKEKLPVFKSDKAPSAQIFGCDACHAYVKCIDLSTDGHAVPAVDDVASLAMSLWAAQNGFRPISVNLFGF